MACKHRHRVTQLFVSFLRRETILALKILIKLLDISGDSTAQRLLRLLSPSRERLLPVLISGMCVQLRHL
jgi:hypothetical protein